VCVQKKNLRLYGVRKEIYFVCVSRPASVHPFFGDLFSSRSVTLCEFCVIVNRDAEKKAE